jgi:hypothetical protein
VLPHWTSVVSSAGMKTALLLVGLSLLGLACKTKEDATPEQFVSILMNVKYQSDKLPARGTKPVTQHATRGGTGDTLPTATSRTADEEDTDRQSRKLANIDKVDCTKLPDNVGECDGDNFYFCDDKQLWVTIARPRQSLVERSMAAVTRARSSSTAWVAGKPPTARTSAATSARRSAAAMTVRAGVRSNAHQESRVYTHRADDGSCHHRHSGGSRDLRRESLSSKTSKTGGSREQRWSDLEGARTQSLTRETMMAGTFVAPGQK